MRRWHWRCRSARRCLTAEIDAALEAMRTDGAIQRLAEQTLGLGAGDLPPFESLPTPAPGVMPSKACIDGMASVEDLTYPDAGMAAPAVLQVGQPFVRTWRLRNVGTCTWNAAYKLSYSRGSSSLSHMNGLPTSVAWQVQPGAEYDLSLSLIAPDVVGTYMGVWELRNDEGRPFGERLHVGVKVGGQGRADTRRPLRRPQRLPSQLRRCPPLGWTG